MSIVIKEKSSTLSTVDNNNTVTNAIISMKETLSQYKSTTAIKEYRLLILFHTNKAN